MIQDYMMHFSFFEDSLKRKSSRQITKRVFFRHKIIENIVKNLQRSLRNDLTYEIL